MHLIVKCNKRHRYIGFIVKTLDKNLTKSEMVKEIRSQSGSLFQKDCTEMGIRLIRFDGTAGIIKCNYLAKEQTITLLQSIKKIEVETIATSGTIRSLIKKHMQSYL